VIRWDKKFEDTLPKEFPVIVEQLDKVVQSGNYDIRSVYSALAALTESYREGIRSMMSDKEYFDSFINTMDIIIQDMASTITRPIFEKAVSEAEKK